jgi:glycosyltransferase involved in cell wall biosynthesis
MTPNDEPLVSIVTPVYNGERHIRQCIESVLSQTWSNWEYIIVNNRSTDDTLSIAQSYAARDTRIKVRTNDEFVGVIANHNNALRHISPESKYVKFVHADDWLFPECVASMVKLAEAHPSVGLIGAYRLEHTKIELAGLEYPSTRVPGRWIARQTLLGSIFVFGSPSSTMLRAEAVCQLTPLYNEENLHADTEACYRILQSWDFGFVHQVLTYTRRHEGSVTASVAAPLNTHIAGHMAAFLKYGRKFLTPDEYAARFSEMTWEYYEFLGRRAVALPGRAFWAYHRKQLERFGIPFRYLYVVPYFLSEAAQVLCSPTRTARGLRRRYMREKATGRTRTQASSA